MKLPPSIRLVISSPVNLIMFVLVCVLLSASVYPLFVMVRTSFQSAGDPLEGTPDRIVLARAQPGGLTVHNQPMREGVWSEQEGFQADPSAWSLDTEDNVYLAELDGAAIFASWDGDIRRVRRMEVNTTADLEGWRIAWRNLAGDVAVQPMAVSDGTAAAAPSTRMVSVYPPERAGQPFDGMQVVAFKLIAPEPGAQWTEAAIVPKRFTTVNFTNVWRADNFSRYTFNSFFVAVMVTIGAVVTSLCAGYAFARSESRLRTVFWIMVLGSMLIPAQVLLIPAFLILQNFPLFGGNDLFGQGGIGLLDSYSGLILPNLVMPLGIFLVRQSLLSMPDSYEEAAVMDGASIPKLLWHVIAPLQRPILATVALLAFLFNWNSFIFPLILIQTPSMRTLPVGLALYSARDTVDWVHLMAASTLTALPIFIIFLFFQRQLISGLVHEGVKG